MSESGFTGWAILELMGHRRLAGYVQPVAQYGGEQLRIDVYVDGSVRPVLTQFYGGAAIYCLTPSTEALCRAYSAHNEAGKPVAIWELPRPSEPVRRAEDTPEAYIEVGDPGDDPYDDAPF